MPDLIIKDSEFLGDNGYFFQALCGKKEGYVSFNASGFLTVCCRNASHKVFRGSGKTFQSLREALAAYKSMEMRIIVLAGTQCALEKIEPERFNSKFLDSIRSDLEYENLFHTQR